MITKTVEYEGFDGVKRKETCHFHYSEAELMEMELSVEGGFQERVQRMVDAKNGPELFKVFKNFLIGAYGVVSPDGRRLMKNDEIRAAFVESPAYSEIIMGLLTGDVTAAFSDFVIGVVPKKMQEKLPKDFAALQAQN